MNVRRKIRASRSPAPARCVRLLLCCVFLIAPTVQAQATSAELAGVIVTEEEEPLADVVLSIGGTDLSARSDGSGRFHFAAAPWGQVRLRARAVGFAPLDTLMLLQSGLAYTVRLRLTRFVPQLDTVRVEATLAYGKPARYRHTSKFDDFYERRAKKPGSYFTREDIERSGRSRVTELISTVPGITLQDRGGQLYLRVARCTAPTLTLGSSRGPPPRGWFAVFLDGQRLQADPLDVLNELKTSEIETIEVYRGVSQLPVEAMGNACAAVFITTRYTPGSVLDTNR